MSKFDFTISFQKQFLAALLRDPETAFTYKFIISPDYFEGDGMTMICGALFDYMGKFRKLPRRSVLKDKIRREVRKYMDDPPFEKLVLKLLKELYDIKIHDTEYICSLAGSFAQEAEWKNFLIEAIDKLEAQDFEGLEDGALTCREKGRIVYPYVLTDQLDQRLERMEEIVEGGLIKTGIKHIDRIFKIYPPAFGLIIGDSGKGKTWFLLHLTRAALLQGYNVLFITGEMSPDDLSLRFDASLLGINTSYFYDTETHDSLRPRLKKKYKKLKGELTILKFAAGMYSVGELDADIRRFCLQKERAPTVVCVDYMDLITYRDSARRGISEWSEQKLVAMYLQGIAHNSNILLYAAGTLLTKRQDKNDRLADRSDKAGAGDVVYYTDYYWVLNQGMKDAELNHLWIYADKTRKQESEILFKIQTDFMHSRFCKTSIGSIRKATLDAKRKIDKKK